MAEYRGTQATTSACARWYAPRRARRDARSGRRPATASEVVLDEASYDAYTRGMAGNDAQRDTVIARDSGAGSSTSWRAVVENTNGKRSEKSEQVPPTRRLSSSPLLVRSLSTHCGRVQGQLCIGNRETEHGGASSDPETALLRYVLDAHRPLVHIYTHDEGRALGGPPASVCKVQRSLTFTH